MRLVSCCERTTSRTRRGTPSSISNWLGQPSLCTSVLRTSFVCPAPFVRADVRLYPAILGALPSWSTSFGGMRADASRRRPRSPSRLRTTMASGRPPGLGSRRMTSTRVAASEMSMAASEDMARRYGAPAMAAPQAAFVQRIESCLRTLLSLRTLSDIHLEDGAPAVVASAQCAPRSSCSFWRRAAPLRSRRCRPASRGRSSSSSSSSAAAPPGAAPPSTSASIWSKLTYGWATPLLRLGRSGRSASTTCGRRRRRSPGAASPPR